MFSKKIYNRCGVIPINHPLYITKDSRVYRNIGLRKWRKGNETLLYSIPNNNNPEHPYIKGFQRNELDSLWSFLIKNKSISQKNFEQLFPDLTKEGMCCFAAFYGIVDYIYPTSFVKVKAVINLKSK